MKDNCICIAGDVKDSRRQDPVWLIASLKECQTLLNETFADDLLIPFDIRNGDEVVGVLKRFSVGYFAARRLMEVLQEKEIHLYTGLGLGHLDTPDATVHTMNGTAVLNAFQARDHFLKKQLPEVTQWKTKGKKKTDIFFYSEAYPYQALNALLYAILEKTYSRTDKQKKAIDFIRQNPGFSYEQIGKELGYESPKSTISYLLARADYDGVNAMEDSLQSLLDDLQKWFKKEEL
ncbi:MAG TPA: hypothetical protein VFK33_13040 [Bacillales bacterium]|nr:hypothetical protein [Bacillales bacterium]